MKVLLEKIYARKETIFSYSVKEEVDVLKAENSELKQSYLNNVIKE